MLRGRTNKLHRSVVGVSASRLGIDRKEEQLGAGKAGYKSRKTESHDFRQGGKLDTEDI